MVAALLTDARGRILLARRTAGRDLAGLWEFPGGKVEAGESPDAALVRELREELGIDIGPTEPVIAVPHAYPEKRILLDVRRVAHFAGHPRGLESQALSWVAPEKLVNWPMPRADRPVVAALRQPDRYLVTPEPGDDDAAFLRTLKRALGSGVRRVQLRAKSLPFERLRKLALRGRDLAATHFADVLLNSASGQGDDAGAAFARNVELARELGIGLHLTDADLRACRARPRLPVVAASCHDADGLRHADALGCDFAVLGPVRGTASHPEAAPIGWHGFAGLRECTGLPVYAIGGLSMDDLATARAHGAQGIAAIRGLWPQTE